jgi:hypothetical protein
MGDYVGNTDGAAVTRHASINALRAAISPDVTIVDVIDDNGRNDAPTPFGAPTEHAEQCALFAWAAANEAAHPELAMLAAVPNGGARHPAVAAQLKAEGVKAGYPDILLDCARGRWHGLRIELKRADHSNTPTKAQQEWIMRLRYYGYSAVVAYGCDEAINAIMAYLAQE